MEIDKPRGKLTVNYALSIFIDINLLSAFTFDFYRHQFIIGFENGF